MTARNFIHPDYL
ncbi:hypothetical protein AYI68_g1460, partial [Smittium mucronatum]